MAKLKTEVNKKAHENYFLIIFIFKKSRLQFWFGAFLISLFKDFFSCFFSVAYLPEIRPRFMLERALPPGAACTRPAAAAAPPVRPDMAETAGRPAAAAGRPAACATAAWPAGEAVNEAGVSPKCPAVKRSLKLKCFHVFFLLLN